MHAMLRRQQRRLPAGPQAACNCRTHGALRQHTHTTGCRRALLTLTQQLLHWPMHCTCCCVLQCIYRLEHEGWDFLLHGVFCLLVFTNLTYTGVMHFYGECWLLGRPAGGGGTLDGYSQGIFLE
jgi:hypothetical protein